MAVKYIQKNNKGLWTISNSKTGKVLRTTNTQKEAIAIAGSTKTTEGIMIKRSSGWGAATGWDQKIANSTKSATTLKQDKGDIVKKPIIKKPAAKKPAAKKVAPKKVVAKKAPVKKVEAKKVEPKKVEAKKAPVKKVEGKKPTSKVPTKPKKSMNGYLGLLIGLLIIGVVIGGAFLLGYYL